MTTITTEFTDFEKKSTIAELHNPETGDLLVRVSVKFGDTVPEADADDMRAWLSGAVVDEIEFRLDPEGAMKKALVELLGDLK